MERNFVEGNIVLETLDVSKKVKDAVKKIVNGHIYTPETLEIINLSAQIADTLVTEGLSNYDVEGCIKYIDEIFKRIKVG